jgi:hypothetical protein
MQVETLKAYLTRPYNKALAELDDKTNDFCNTCAVKDIRDITIPEESELSKYTIIRTITYDE